MKTVLVLAAVMGLLLSAASAECMGHKQVSASVDTETKVASVVKQVPPVVGQDAKTEEAKQQQAD
jgi:hypothetical protein